MFHGLCFIYLKKYFLLIAEEVIKNINDIIGDNNKKRSSEIQTGHVGVGINAVKLIERSAEMWTNEKGTHLSCLYYLCLNLY